MEIAGNFLKLTLPSLLIGKIDNDKLTKFNT